ncbi:hypothetical protein SAMN02745216_01108 [Desulfatibacillum alkenivorans DSM 16219]|jgi:hypothetical protein|uniref:Outer membrane protein beta-barrel domain-containing protein n=1 Tax=Desulfatibacillum alkenivorans DSM 16219 TaxID=1121393 RepID=A0A1M6GU08_9BACT|nr:hypothetical protein [Desulfatibacillum alkenivorans]SHJ13438.1 hypothetical protein SAMN02745216_01108 [Desulfatibacillum alkenivorans DSM 16219]
MFRILKITSLAVILIAASTSLLPAQGPPTGPTVKLDAAYLSESSVESNQGSYSVAMAGVEASYKYFTVHAAQGRFNWGRVDLLPFGDGVDDPWSQLNKIGLSARYRGKMSDKWGFLLGAGVTSTFEEDMGLPSYSLSGGLSYSFSSKLRAGAGLSLGHNDIETTVMPFISFGYDYGNSRNNGVFASIGWPRLSAGYRFSPEWAAKVSLTLDSRTYQLATGGIYKLRDDSPVYPEGYVGLSGYSPGLSLEYTPAPSIKVALGLSWWLNSEMDLYNAGGDKQFIYDIEDSLGGSLQFQYRF